MFIPNEAVTDWKDLQNKVAELYIEMGYIAKVQQTIELAGRGSKEIDVLVTDPTASCNRIYLVECKNWGTRVPKEVVHSFKTVMEGSGANTGFIISKIGFQAGAKQAARFTNIWLLTFEELQHLYGAEWFRKQKAKLEQHVDKLKEIAHLHFNQMNLLGIHNNMFFHTPELAENLLYYNKWVLQLISIGNSIWPESYLGPEPVKAASDPLDPLNDKPGWFLFPTVRAYFAATIEGASRCAAEFDKLFTQARTSFDHLPEELQGDAMSQNLREYMEETPMRVLKRYITQQEYNNLLRLVAKGIATDVEQTNSPNG